jgi:ferredoxin
MRLVMQPRSGVPQRAWVSMPMPWRRRQASSSSRSKPTSDFITPWFARLYTAPRRQQSGALPMRRWPKRPILSRSRIGAHGTAHTERFGSRSPTNPGVVGADPPSPREPPGTPGAGPAVTFARSGPTTTWSDTYASVLELAEACDVPTRWSCRTGVCHTCVTEVLSGAASYETPPIEAPGEDELLICSAQPTADLVLDLCPSLLVPVAGTEATMLWTAIGRGQRPAI